MKQITITLSPMLEQIYTGDKFESLFARAAADLTMNGDICEPEEIAALILLARAIYRAEEAEEPEDCTLESSFADLIKAVLGDGDEE